ncbi:UNVERIFIED_CONTAM: hypothetical protein FKN15_073577 [Acipenser sinensis]
MAAAKITLNRKPPLSSSNKKMILFLLLLPCVILTSWRKLGKWFDRPHLLPPNQGLHDTARPTEVKVNEILQALKKLVPKVNQTQVELTSSGAHSLVTLMNPKVNYCVGEIVSVRVEMNDYRGKPKTYGGDFILARIHSPELKAGAAGVPEDFNNGTYRVNFTLFWPGSVKVSVLLMHSSEVLFTLWQAKEYCNDKFIFTGTFLNGMLQETSICDIHLSTNEPVCEFKDERNQESFFCFKPKTLPCETLHYTSSRNIEVSCLTQAEKQLLKRNQTVISYLIQGEAFRYSDCLPSGDPHWPTCNYRYSPCKYCNIHGLYLKYTSKTEPKAPKLAIDKRRNITISWKMHGFPCISFSPCFISGGIYIVQELDRLAGGENTVVVISVGLHIRPFPLKFYITRMVTIKQAVTRLLQRSPLTRVFVKSENTRELNSEKIRMSNWHGHLQNLALKEVFSGVKVGFIDAWDMTLAANTFEFHPNRNIVHNQIALFLSYLCGPNS